MPSLEELTGQLADLDTAISENEQIIKEQKALRKTLVERDLPNKMREMGVPKATQVVGNRQFDLKITNKIVGSLSRAPDQDKALAYLTDKGFSGAAKATISVTVSDDERDDALASLGPRAKEAKVDRKINHNTLAAFARDCFANGDGFDLDVVGLTSLTEVTIKETSDG